MLWYSDPRQGNGVTGNLLRFTPFDLSDTSASCSESSSPSTFFQACDRGAWSAGHVKTALWILPSAPVLFCGFTGRLGKQKEPLGSTSLVCVWQFLLPGPSHLG